ncbi:MAG: amino acid adenylation domain-containing protein, partial [bacterium]|nr:amino acid adenylation domain-containing protein [bacterium]
KQWLLYDLNDTETDMDFSRDQKLHQLVEEQAARTPHHTAVIFDGREMDYARLNREADSLARVLRIIGLQTGYVAVIMDRGIDMVAALLGILKAGGAYVPLEPGLPIGRVAGILKSIGIHCVITNESRLDKNLDIARHVTGFGHLICLDGEPSAQSIHNAASIGMTIIGREQISQFPGENLTPLPTAIDTAYVIHTSGTTGVPKGVAVTHRPVINLIRWVNSTFNIDHRDTALCVVSIGFDLSVYDVFGMLSGGGRIRIASHTDTHDPQRLLDILLYEGITIWNSTPAALQQLTPFFPSVKDHTHQSRLRLVFFSGDWIPVTLPGILKETFNGVRVIGLGGPTETTVWSNVFPIQEVDPSWKSIPYGKPIQNVRHYVLDHYLQPRPVGVAGELYTGGACLADGYLNDVELTASKFIPNPFEHGQTIYKTGDMCRWRADGNLEILGRTDHQVKLRGFRIETGEIESRLLTHPNVAQAVVRLHGSTHEEKYLCGYIIPVNKEETPEDELKRHLSETLPDYMIPSYFVTLESFPLSPNRKVDRSALPEPDRFHAGDSTQYVAPRDPVEQRVAEIWGDILPVPKNKDKKKIGIHSDFFQLGGNSLKAVQLVSIIHQQFNIKPELTKLFNGPKLSQVAQFIRDNQAHGHQFSPIPPVEKKEYYPLSPSQERLYFIQRMDPESTRYNMLSRFHIHPETQPRHLEAAVNTLVRRHESFRTSFHMLGETSVQRVHDEVSFEIGFLAANRTNGREEKPFDLTQAPLLRVRLAEPGTGARVLEVEMHHIISDAASQDILHREFEALLKGEELPPLKVQYKDFAEWRNTKEQQTIIETQEHYWLREFKGELPVLDLPRDFPRPRFQSHKGRRSMFFIPAPLTQRLQSLSRQTGATLYMVLLASLNILLSKLSGQQDIIIGSPVAARGHAGLRDIIGMFVNTLCLRNYPNGDKSFNQFLRETRSRTLEVYENQDYPFEKLVDKTEVKRDTGRNPLFDVMFNFLDQPLYNGGIDNEVIHRILDLGQANSLFDITFQAAQQDNIICFTVEFCTDLYRTRTIERFISYFKGLLNWMSRTPQEPISAAQYIPEEEKNRLLVEFNNTTADVPRDKTLHQLFEEQEEKTPDNIAVVDAHGNAVTYNELNREANHLARLLREEGVETGSIVAIMIERSIEMITGLLGILKAGGAYLPIDPSYPDDRIKYMLGDSGAKVLITDQKVKWKIATNFVNLMERLPGSPSHLPIFPPSNPSALAYIIYTSGTTGTPKGVLVQHASAVNLVISQNRYFNFDSSERVLQFSSLSFDPSVEQIFMALSSGAVLQLVDRDTLLDGHGFVSFLQTRSVTHLDAVPSFLAQLPPGLQEVSSMKWIISGGDLCPMSLARKIKPYCNLYNQYGPTETTVTSIRFNAGSITGTETRLPIGVPIDNTTVYILDRWQQLVPIGVSGELYIGGAGVARGYLNQPELTTHRFLNLSHETVYRTGDLTRWLEDGNIEFLGRVDRQVKIRGIRIELGEIENRLSRIPSVRETVVIARTGQDEETYLCAYIIPVKEDRTPSIVPGLSEQLARVLPQYMIPNHFVLLEEFPLNANKKIDRSRLPHPLENLEPRAVVPLDGLEAKLVDIWSGLLGIEPRSISRDVNFFRIGGHSLKAGQLTLKIRQELNVEVPLAEIFNSQTIAQLARYIRRLPVAPHVSIEPVEKKEYYPLSPPQRRFYNSQKANPGSVRHHLTFRVPFEKGIDSQQLKHAMETLIRRHETFRTSFHEIDGIPVQVVHDHVSLDIERYGLAANRTNDREERPFDLERVPLLRVGLLEQGDGSYILEVEMHHLLTDGASDGILRREFSALLGGRELVPPRLQYRDYAQWQDSVDQQQLMKSQESYWLEQFPVVPPVFELPYDFSRPAVRSFEGRVLAFFIDHEVTARLKDLMLKADATLYMVLLAAFNVLFWKLSGGGDIVIGTPVAVRRHVDVQDMIGIMTNRLAMRNFPAGDKTFLGFLKEVRACTLGAYENQDYPFEMLVERIPLSPTPGRNPMLDVLLNLLNQAEYEIPVPVDGVVVDEIMEEGGAWANYDLTIRCFEGEGMVYVSVVYSTELFKGETVKGFVRQFKGILDHFARTPEKRLDSI